MEVVIGLIAAGAGNEKGMKGVKMQVEGAVDVGNEGVILLYE